MEQDLKENLIKLNQLLRKQAFKKPILKPSKYCNLHLMLARSVSVSTEQSSRTIQNKTKLSCQNTTKVLPNKQEPQYFQSKKASLAKEVKRCDSYAQMYKLERKFTITDNVCGLSKIFQLGKL